MSFNRDDFQVKFNPNNDEDSNYSAFLLFEKACFELAGVSYTMYVESEARVRKKNLLYSRMLWGKYFACSILHADYTSHMHSEKLCMYMQA